MAVRIIGCGSYLPPKCIKNSELPAELNSSDEWIQSRTGIKQRFIAENQTSLDMAIAAANQALENANTEPAAIDLIICCTNTPAHIFPSNANLLQEALKVNNNCASFDIAAICAGFIHGLHVARLMMADVRYKTVLVVAVDKMSTILDWQDRSTCVLFGDGAGAVLLQQDNISHHGIVDSHIYSDGSLGNILYTKNVDGHNYLQMHGQAVFKQAVEKMLASAQEILKANNLQATDIKYFIPHQANIRIIDSIANKLHLTPQQIVTTIDQHANCSAASIPLALATLAGKTTLHQGDLILLTAFGAGAAWGSVLLEW